MIELARRLSLDNDVLVVLGGDGTLADVMQGIFEAGRQNDVILGIVPLGSGNAIRASLQIPKSISRAVKVLSRGEPRPIDLIEVDGQIASLVSIGATAKATHKKSQSNDSRACSDISSPPGSCSPIPGRKWTSSFSTAR